MKKYIVMFVLFFLTYHNALAGQKFDFDSYKVGVKQKNLSAVYATGLRKDETSRYDVLGVKYRETRFSSSTDEAGYELFFGDALGKTNNNAIIGTFTYSKYFIVEKESAVSVDFGIGFSYFFKNVYEQGSKFNFIENIGLTYHHSIDSNAAFTLGFSISHISNAGLFPPNRGINSLSFNAGYSWIVP